MNAKFSGRQGENQPTMPGIDRRKPKHVAKESANRAGIFGVDHGMNRVDHGVYFTTATF
jgi:hypothetical protein